MERLTLEAIETQYGLEIGGFGEKLLTYFKQVEASRIEAKKKKRIKLLKRQREEYISRLKHSSINQRDFFESACEMFDAFVSPFIKELTQESASEIMDELSKGAIPIDKIRKISNNPMNLEFADINEFHAYSSAIQFIEKLEFFIENVEMIATHGEIIDENSPGYQKFLEEEINKIKEEGKDRKIVNDVDDYLSNILKA